MRPSVLAPKGEPFNLGSMSFPMHSNSRSLQLLLDPNAHNLKNSQKTASCKPSNSKLFMPVLTRLATLKNLVVTKIILPWRAFLKGMQNFSHSSPPSLMVSPHMSSRTSKNFLDLTQPFSFLSRTFRLLDDASPPSPSIIAFVNLFVSKSSETHVQIIFLRAPFNLQMVMLIIQFKSLHTTN